jgi:radical SAM-linked protein
MTTYTFRFSKGGDLIYISHLDLLRLLNRAARRADLPIALTQGFSPHFKIKLNKALKLGVASDQEEGEFVLSEKLDEHTLKMKLEKELPHGIEIKEIKAKVSTLMGG